MTNPTQHNPCQQFSVVPDGRDTENFSMDEACHGCNAAPTAKTGAAIADETRWSKFLVK
ncbi:hypothetical protein ACQ4M4_28450 [Leptolyngbya sp. AN02str]|uniref:hypothetical protein n=1 Tax=Leptolyngbya sp. AN02str TaxID=3423363 RepID=UPI003D322AD7